MNGQDRRLFPASLREKARAIGRAVFSPERNKQIFLGEIEKSGDSALRDVCEQNIGILGIDNLGSFNEAQIRESARSFVEGYKRVQKKPENFSAEFAALRDFHDKISRLDHDSRMELSRQAKAHVKGEGFGDKLKQFAKEKFGIDAENPMQSIAKKLGLGGKNENEDKTKSESEEAKALVELKSFSIFKGGIVSMIISPVLGIGATAGGVLPFAISFFPLIIAYDSYNVLKKSCGSPFAEGTFHNLVKSFEEGKSYGPTVVNPEGKGENPGDTDKGRRR